MVKVCQTLVQTRSSERVGEARALSCPLAVRAYRALAKALPCQSRADVSGAS